jgi:hypothetical protein
MALDNQSTIYANGWRLPTAEEFGVLLDLTNEPVTIVRDHPFDNVHPEGYWTGTTLESDTISAVDINFEPGEAGIGGDEPKGEFWLQVWCVRGGSSYDGM